MSINYYQRNANIQQVDNSSEDDEIIEPIILDSQNENKLNENKINNQQTTQTNEFKRKSIKDDEDKSDSISYSEDFEEYKKKMKQKSQKGIFQRLYKCLVVNIFNKILFQCINCCFEMICCDDDCIDKMDCITFESCNEDGICDCGFDEDDCC